MADPITTEPVDSEELERRALVEAVAAARADDRPGVPHDVVRADMLRDIERLRRTLARDR